MPLATASGKTAGEIETAALGIYWVVAQAGNNVLLSHRCPLAQGESYGDFTTCPHGHYDVWEQWRDGRGDFPADIRRLISAHEYEEWPRGRVVFNKVLQQFVIYADMRVTRAGLAPIILREFGITDAKFLRDLHYTSTERLANSVPR